MNKHFDLGYELASRCIEAGQKLSPVNVLEETRNEEERQYWTGFNARIEK